MFLRVNRNYPLAILGLLIMFIGFGFLIYPLKASINYYINDIADNNIKYAAIPDLEIAVVPEVANEEGLQVAEKTEPEIRTVSNKPTEIVAEAPKLQPVVKSAMAQIVNKVIIPKIGVDINIIEGKDDSALYKGAWHLPGTSSPNLGGNTVISAHRYLYRPPSSRTFYLLDKLEVGDAIKVYWQGEEYQYQVSEIKIVEPKQVEILRNTSKSILTLFTCTPLFTSKNRLVVIADLVK